MTPGVLAMILFGIGLVLLAAELLLPTHGVLAVLALVSIAWAIGVCFSIDQWLGLGVFLGSVALTPVAWWAAITLWPKTPVGKRLFLQPVKNPAPVILVRVGDAGVAISALRPIGECEFGEHRMEAISEYGMIQPGQSVKIVSINNGRAIVRPTAADQAPAA